MGEINKGDNMENEGIIFLETDNLILRKAKEDDLEKIWNNVWKDKKIADNMLWEPTETREEAVKRMKRTIEYQSKSYAYFVCLKSNNEPIGFAGVWEKEIGIYEDSGICICGNHQRKGYAKEVVNALKKLVFEELNANRFIYGCFSTNEPSRKVCLSQGFKYLESSNIIRQWDSKEFTADYYYFDKEMYQVKGE